MTELELIENAEVFLSRTIDRYGRNMKNQRLPNIRYRGADDFNLQGVLPADNILQLHAQMDYGLTVDDFIYQYFIVKHNLFVEYPRDTIFIFRKPETAGIELSILCHELMHFFFKGIDNSTDVGQGYNEACTDYLAAEIYGEGYTTTYPAIARRATEGPMVYYRNFLDADEVTKREILNIYMAL